ncbi:MAG: nicotinate-nucleotide--dimethylbenzimidazole phosphoribosyltransferase [Alphaproteobacteria bacterium]|nr:nicotinate-nucleotide--dimethylbenzimidazole phosphoribosyltransferase [Alphaproteobacteria bacterium]MDE2112702.1 nicotinate-nucleotide--dimethylbenzimidazole phosphoribosyltransferase [Alphaproteobacteria bacterium]MDE2494733.1 nicotinate-nucleotide--dimethylbenzimidazole phosphoribosyltransferase [Alphaproteobacteria bacterium]
MEWLNLPIAQPDAGARSAAEERQRILTKPPGALGRLEAFAIRLAALQSTPTPKADRIHVTVFAADHGIAAEGVSAFPQAVTAEMIRNFSRGGAAISVLARTLDATLEVVDLGTVADPGPLDGVLSNRIGRGTANFAQEPAMSEAELRAALETGRAAVLRARKAGAQLFIGGEMGIGNSTAATALLCALQSADPLEVSGPGTGLDAAGVSRKAQIIRRALERHKQALSSPLHALRCLGGFEIAALVGSYITCAQIGFPAVVDGFIAGSAALCAERLCTGIRQWLFFSHMSTEPGHRAILTVLNVQPILDLQMRLGEASGAAVSVPILRLACALHNGMATFAEAGVSEKSS